MLENVVLKKIIKRDGKDAILFHTFEELAELMCAISIYRRRSKNETYTLAKEIADVEIMLEFIRVIFDINEHDIIHIKETISKEIELEIKNGMGQRKKS